MSKRQPEPKHYDWTENEVGCYALSVLGTEHIWNTFADLVEEYDKTTASLLRNPGDPCPDDCEIYKAAMEVLYQHTDPSVKWVLDNDGLFLLKK